MTLVSLIFALTYLGLAVGRIPGLRTDRAGVALVGAALCLVLGVLRLPQAVSHIDFGTILLLFSMMVLTAYLTYSGFFAWAAHGISERAHGPFAFLGMVILLSGVLSAFLVNDVVCVALTPLVLHLCHRNGKAPLPHLIAVATASNIGSVSTITGNPQNIIIGSLSGIPYLRFTAHLAPVSVFGLLVDFLLLSVIYRRDLLSEKEQRPVPEMAPLDRGLMLKSLVTILGVIVLFFSGFPIAVVAIGAAAVVVLSRVPPDKIYEKIDWPLLVMFCGLFVVVGAFQATVVSRWNLAEWHPLLNSPVVLLSGASVLLSNLVSNVPAVLLFRPIMAVMPRAETAWLALSMSCTLAGNLTLLGSVANLIVAETARRENVEISFLEYLKVGVPLTCITVAAGVVWLSLVA